MAGPPEGRRPTSAVAHLRQGNVAVYRRDRRRLGAKPWRLVCCSNFCGQDGGEWSAADGTHLVAARHPRPPGGWWDGARRAELRLRMGKGAPNSTGVTIPLCFARSVLVLGGIPDVVSWKPRRRCPAWWPRAASPLPGRHQPHGSKARAYGPAWGIRPGVIVAPKE